MTDKELELFEYVFSLAIGEAYSEEIKEIVNLQNKINYVLKEKRELDKQLKEKNLVDLGFCDNEPIGFKYDRSINKPVLACRCDNYYYAYPTKNGWVYYRSRYLGERDKEIEDMSFIDWAYAVLKEVK